MSSFCVTRQTGMRVNFSVLAFVNPLQYSCLENPRDGGAWWAAIYGVAELDMTDVTWWEQQHLSQRSNHQ